MSEEVPNDRGAVLIFSDDLDEWSWKDRDAVTHISASAVRQFLDEVRHDCGISIHPWDDTPRLVVTALHGEFRIEADLGTVLRHFLDVAWDDCEKEGFRRLLQSVLESM